MKERGLSEHDILQFLEKQRLEREALAKDLHVLEKQKEHLVNKDQEETKQIGELK